MLTIKKLAKILKESWSAETSYWPERWTSENPALGQCFVIALIVQDFFGGIILKTKISGLGSHYFNRLPNGQEIDLTFSQFTMTGSDGLDRGLAEKVKNEANSKALSENYQKI